MANGLSHISSCALFPQACRCEHSYEHKWCHDAHIKWRVTSYVIRFMFFLMTGTSVGYSQWVGRVEQVSKETSASSPALLTCRRHASEMSRSGRCYSVGIDKASPRLAG
eukprot:scaffold173882_cov32-Tisochrysis_lutea.AAC.3